MTSKKVRVPTPEQGWDFQVGKTYLIHWMDHWASGGWTTTQDQDDNAMWNPCITVGICSFSSEKTVHISATASQADGEGITVYYTATMGILQNCITEAWELTNVL